MLLDCGRSAFTSTVTSVLSHFRQCLSPVVLTHATQNEWSIIFLDLRLSFGPNHVCWEYDPRSQKPSLSFQSAHSKLTKRGIVRHCFANDLMKSCSHVVEDSFKKQTVRLKSAGYPPFLVVSVTDKMLKQLRSKPDVEPREKEREKLKCAVVPYLHGISHNLKAIGKRVSVNVVFSAPSKLSIIMNRVNGKEKKKSKCATQHRDRFVNCSEGTGNSFQRNGINCAF